MHVLRNSYTHSWHTNEKPRSVSYYSIQMHICVHYIYCLTPGLIVHISGSYLVLIFFLMEAKLERRWGLSKYGESSIQCRWIYRLLSTLTAVLPIPSTGVHTYLPWRSTTYDWGTLQEISQGVSNFRCSQSSVTISAYSLLTICIKSQGMFSMLWSIGFQQNTL